MHFETREDYIRWATVILLTAMDLRTDHNALESAQMHAIHAADLYFPKGEHVAAPRGSNPYQDPPSIKAPPQVRTVGPQVPGQRATVGEETTGNG